MRRSSTSHSSSRTQKPDAKARAHGGHTNTGGYPIDYWLSVCSGGHAPMAERGSGERRWQAAHFACSSGTASICEEVSAFSMGFLNRSHHPLRSSAPFVLCVRSPFGQPPWPRRPLGGPRLGRKSVRCRRLLAEPRFVAHRCVGCCFIVHVLRRPCLLLVPPRLLMRSLPWPTVRPLFWPAGGKC